MVEKKEVTIKKTTKKNSQTKNTKNKNSSKKNDKKGNNFKKKILYACITILLLIVVICLSFMLKQKDRVVITIDNIEYTEVDFNMYAYLVKYEYFGVNGTKLDENTLNTQVSNDSKQTVREYLKEKTISKIKLSAAISRVANENNITLNKNDEVEIDVEMKQFIEELGGKKAYKETLKVNKTTSDAYLKVARIEKLYDKIFDSLYSEGKRNDLTKEELELYTENYYEEYVKVKQVILLKKDLSTNKYLDEITINQKEALANQIVVLAKEEGSNFDALIEKYSDAYKEKVLSEYYLKNSLVDELKSAILLLNVGDISGVVSTDNAYHIVIREELDDFKLGDYYNSKREDKLIKDIADNLNKIAIINSDYLEDIMVH